MHFIFKSLKTMDISVDLAEASEIFLEPRFGPYSFHPTQGGVNNNVFYIHNGCGERIGVMRVYNNGNDSSKVRFEHEVIRQLLLQSLSFEVPRALPVLNDPSTTHATLSSGADAAAFHLIRGKLPKLRLAKEIGRASGELSTALSRVVIGEIKPVIPPYYDLYHVHHAITKEKFLDGIKSSTYDDFREYADILLVELLRVEECLDSLDIPKQLIHGDLHFDNVLCDEDQLIGILDFEFCAMDYRAMELAICLSKYVGEENPFTLCSEFIQGYVLHGRLNSREIELVPTLIILRIVSNVVYFVSRALSGD